MADTLRACVVGFLHKHPELVLDTLRDATNLATFKQWLRAEAKANRQRSIARAVDAAELDLSPESMEILHAADDGV